MWYNKIIFVCACCSFFFKGYIYLFLETGEGREEERKRNIHVWLPLACPLLGTWSTTQACAPTGNQTSSPLVRRPALSPLNHTSLVLHDVSLMFTTPPPHAIEVILSILCRCTHWGFTYVCNLPKATQERNTWGRSWPQTCALYKVG